MDIAPRRPDGGGSRWGERTVFTLRYFEGYNAKELGDMFDLPSATVRSRLASAKRRLRQWVEE